MNGYELSRNWFDWSFENPEKVSPNHSALYFFAIEHCNRLGWREKFGFPTEMAKDAIGIKSYTTYIKTLNDLVDWGFVKMIERSKNQYSSNIIALTEYDKALDKALDKAIVKHVVKQVESTCESIVSIDKQLTNKPITIPEKEKGNPTHVINWEGLLNQFNEITGKKSKVVDDKSKKQFLARLKEGYTKVDIVNAITNCYNSEFHKGNGHKNLTLEFISRPDKFAMYFDFKETIVKPIKQDRL